TFCPGTPMSTPLAGSRDGVEEPARSRYRILAALVACHGLNDLYALVIPPMLPAMRLAFGLSYSAVSIVPYLTIGTSALLQPTVGYVADRRALRRLTMASGFLFLSLGMLALGLSRSYVAVLGAALLLGVGASTYHPQSAT